MKLNCELQSSIERGWAMISGDYVIEQVLNIYGEPSEERGFYIHHRNGDVVEAAHLDSRTLLLEPIKNLDDAIAWCEAH